VAFAQPVLSPFLSAPDKKMLIDGQWVESLSGGSIASLNPATGEEIARIPEGAEADIDRAVRSARAAFEGEWARWKPYDRQRLLIRVHDLVEKHWEEIATLETLDMGAPLSRTRVLKTWVLHSIMYYANQVLNVAGSTLPNSLPGEHMTFSVKAPLGVVGGIIPWNGPIIAMWWIIAPALATGCTVVLKPAEDASLTSLRVGELLQEAGVPAGVVNIVTGYGSTAGAALAAHRDVDRIAFTGSTQTGRKIVQASAGNLKRLHLELGGKSPDIVFADADLDRAAPGAAMGVFNNSGQICFSGTRVFVERSIQEEFVERMAEFGRSLKVGNGLDESVRIGPLISARQLSTVSAYVDLGREEGGRLALGGERPGGDLAQGYFFQPTIFADMRNDMRIAREEIFGPVICVIPFDTPDEALRLANDSDYGLGGGVWTRNIHKAMKMVHGVKSGALWVNSYGVIDPAVGFGGTKLSGYGIKGGPSHIDTFMSQKNVYMDLA